MGPCFKNSTKVQNRLLRFVFQPLPLYGLSAKVSFIQWDLHLHSSLGMPLGTISDVRSIGICATPLSVQHFLAMLQWQSGHLCRDDPGEELLSCQAEYYNTLNIASLPTLSMGLCKKKKKNLTAKL
jgi:hypothetical protein